MEKAARSGRQCSAEHTVTGVCGAVGGAGASFPQARTKEEPRQKAPPCRHEPPAHWRRVVTPSSDSMWLVLSTVRLPALEASTVQQKAQGHPQNHLPGCCGAGTSSSPHLGPSRGDTAKALAPEKAGAPGRARQGQDGGGTCPRLPFSPALLLSSGELQLFPCFQAHPASPRSPVPHRCSHPQQAAQRTPRSTDGERGHPATGPDPRREPDWPRPGSDAQLWSNQLRPGVGSHSTSMPRGMS